MNFVLQTLSIWTLAILLAAVNLGCAGPATPLGSVWVMNATELKLSSEEIPVRGDVALAAHSARIQFFPARQVLHDKKPLTVVIEDPDGVDAKFKLKVRYNGYDVTRSFLKQASLQKKAEGKKLVLTIPAVRLQATKDHSIEILYTGITGDRAYSQYLPPVCGAFDSKTIRRTGPFEPGARLLKTIERVARQEGFNPAFVAALIAQESSFNPRTVSWARALGLTQITPIAARELADRISKWPRYPNLEKLGPVALKALILSGEINERNDWRLADETSIRGGLMYARILAERLASEQRRSRELASVYGDERAERTRLLLASYNSGLSRVLDAVRDRGASWDAARELREARRYSSQVVSYCDYFSENEVHHEDET